MWKTYWQSCRDVVEQRGLGWEIVPMPRPTFWRMLPMVYQCKCSIHCMTRSRNTRWQQSVTWSSCEDFVLVFFSSWSHITPQNHTYSSKSLTHTNTHRRTWTKRRTRLRPVHALDLMIEPSASSNVAKLHDMHSRNFWSKHVVVRSMMMKQSRLESYLDKCIRSVQLKNSTAYVPQCLRLALNILTHSTVSEKIQRERLIRDVNARQECVKELISFLQHANEAKISWTEILKLTGCLTFEQAVNCRLSFLLSLVTDSKDGSFNYEEISNLWNAFCNHKSSSQELVERFLSWISNLSLTRDVTRDVFDKLLCSDSGERICAQYEKGIKCAQIFLPNERSEQEWSSHGSAVRDSWMSTIWNIAMSEHTEKVISRNLLLWNFIFIWMTRKSIVTLYGVRWLENVWNVLSPHRVMRKR